jgi:glycosyltransferase involved in cell wall biosynthesis
MILVIDVAADPGRTATVLAERGLRPDRIIRRDALKLGRLAATMRELRKVRADVCYIFCRQLHTQFNRLPLKMMAVLSGARSIHFCDEQETGPELTRAGILARDVPLYFWRCLYALAVAFGFLIAYSLVWIGVRISRPPARAEGRCRRLCYIKTDFWHDLKAGGSVTHTREFVNAGSDLGYDIAVFACDPLVHYRLKPEVEVVEPSAGLYDLPILVSQLEYNIRFPLAVWWRLRGTAVDGIYQRHSSNNFSGVTLSLLLRVPFLLEFNTPLAWAAKNWSAGVPTLPRLCENLNLRGAFQVGVVSQALRQNLLSMGVSGAKVIVNPNGVDPRRFGPHVDTASVRSQMPAGRLLVGFIGVFGQWHGVLTLMRSVKHVVRAFPDAHFVIVGDGALKHRMTEILTQDGTTDHVTFVGLVKHDLAPAYLNACDILVSPHEDMADGSPFFGSPTKIFEYMACGKGIVASKVGQLGDLFRHEQDALLVEQRDEVQLAEAIVRLLRDSPLRERLGAAARRKAIASYTWEENFRRAVARPPIAEGSQSLCSRVAETRA